MTIEFMSDDLLLTTETARRLYHDYAADMPIYDYHCHLPPADIAADRNFDNLTQIWLNGDHYKWRAMRSNGIDERFITGSASDYEKFEKWSQTAPYAIGNPLYVWTHLELKRPFGITGKRLGPDTAKEIYDRCSEMLRSPEFSVRNIMRKMNVKMVCTTEDPLDNLEHHQKIAADNFDITVSTAWRPDKALACENVESLNEWINGLEKAADCQISSFDDYLTAIRKRHDYFHANGCRIADHGLTIIPAADYTESQINDIFNKLRSGRPIGVDDCLKFQSALLYELMVMNHQKNWSQQLHFGALRNNNSRMMNILGPDTGYDSISDFHCAQPLARLLDRLDRNNQLTRTILYNLNPADNELMATMLGNFQDGKTPGKIQYGSGWWFLDQRDGMQKQMTVLANLGLLSRFVGMLTDSRSFLSYPRHEYFRRILCKLLGEWAAIGEIPNDTKSLGPMVQNICFNNAQSYFQIELPGR